MFWKGSGCLGFVFVEEQARGELSGSTCCLVTVSLITLFLSDSRERVDQMLREKEKLRSDLDKAEKLKSLMASEVDDHHAAIERRNEHNLRWDGRGQGPPFPPPWPRAAGFCLPAHLLGHTWLGWVMGRGPICGPRGYWELYFLLHALNKKIVGTSLVVK